MKIQSHASAVPAFQREGLKPAQSNRANRSQPDTGAPTPAEAPAKKTAPPGLERVLARLESLGETGRTQGQSQAMDRISRNLARYQETQALAPLPQPEPPVESEPVVEVPVEPEATDGAPAPTA
jgi:hypothetical protein